MKTCPSCNRAYTDEDLNFCLQDGAPLVNAAPPPSETTATARYPVPRDTDPPPTAIYHPNPPPPISYQGTQYQQPYTTAPQYTPMPMARQPRSNAIWWILGGLAVVVVLGIGAVIMIIAIASMSSDTNNNRFVSNANSSNTSRPNTNTNTNTNSSNTNSIANLPASFSDDFSTQKWGTGSSAYGNIWYADNQYHMKSKEKTYFVMYAPTNDYDTENAKVRVTVRVVDGISPVSGYGLVVHGASAAEEKLKDYGFLIYSGENPKYEVVLHKGGTETAVVPWTTSSTIRSGSSTNQIEVRIKGAQLSLYLNGQYVTSITDTANFKRGRAGFYASDSHEVAFDDLQINR